MLGGWLLLGGFVLSTPQPAHAGELGAYRRSDGVNCVVYRASDNHIDEMCLIGGVWRVYDPSVIRGATPAVGAPAVYIRWDNLNIAVYRGSDNHFHELATPGGSIWETADLSALGGAPLAAGDPAAYRRSDVVTAVVYRGFDQDIHELDLLDGGAQAMPRLPSH